MQGLREHVYIRGAVSILIVGEVEPLTVYLLLRSVSFTIHSFVSGDFAVICKMVKYSDAFLVFIYD